MKSKNTPDGSSVRSKRFDVFLSAENKNLFGLICDHIKKCRELARKCFAMDMMIKIIASDGGFDKNGRYTIKPDGEKVQQILNIGFGKSSAQKLYELKDFSKEHGVATWKSFVADHVRMSAHTATVAKDPEFPQTHRDWLILQFMRRLGSFDRVGIKGDPTGWSIKMSNHSATLTWDKDIGPVEFKLGRLDGGAWAVWRSLVAKAEGWKLGATTLNVYEKTEGNKKYRQLCLDVSFHRPDQKASLNPDKVMIVEFADDPDNFITCRMDAPEGIEVFKADKLSAVEAIGWLKELYARSSNMANRKKAAGNPHRKWGSSKISEAIKLKLNRVTDQRSNGVKHRNHLWTRRIVEQAIRSEAGRLIVVNAPTNSQLFEQPWNWSQFKSFLKYKCLEFGIREEYIDTQSEKVA